MACFENHDVEEHKDHLCCACEHYPAGGECKFQHDCLDARLEGRPGKCHWKKLIVKQPDND